MRKTLHPPPPPNHPHIWDTKSEQGNRGLYINGYRFQFFFNAGNSMKREEKLRYNKFLFLFFSIFKKFLKILNNIPSISKTIQHTPMTWCMYLQSFEKIHQCVFWVTVRKLNVTDRRTDGQTDGQMGGRCNISRPGPSAPREIIKRL